MPDVCQINACDGPTVGRGLCRKHYMRLNRKGNTDDRRKNERAICVVDECSRGATAYGYCHGHKGRSEQYAARRAAKLAKDRAGRACLHCGEPVPVERKATAIYCSSRCKHRHRDADGRMRESLLRSYFRLRYGLTLEQVEEMAAGGCQICGTTEWNGRHARPHVDHCHETGRIRGILCSECNTGIGKLKDSPDLLRKALEYLTRG